MSSQEIPPTTDYVSLPESSQETNDNGIGQDSTLMTVKANEATEVEKQALEEAEENTSEKQRIINTTSASNQGSSTEMDIVYAIKTKVVNEIVSEKAIEPKRGKRSRMEKSSSRKMRKIAESSKQVVKQEEEGKESGSSSTGEVQRVIEEEEEESNGSSSRESSEFEAELRTVTYWINGGRKTRAY